MTGREDRTGLITRLTGSDRARTAGRAVVMGVVVFGLAGGAVVAGRRALEVEPVPALTWFTPYIDATLTPRYAFEDPEVTPGGTVVLGFVVADPAADGDAGVASPGCTPTWGGYYGLDEAATGMDLDRRITRFRERGGDVVVSFGGAANEELALTCEDEGALADAYRSVIERYQSSTIDLDIEAGALDDPVSVARRARVVAAVQAEMALEADAAVQAEGGEGAEDDEAASPAGEHLAVWLTLPVTPDGMLDNAVAVVDAMLAAGVDLAGVNLMTMDYGGSRPDTQPMGEAVLSSLRASHRQLGDAYRRAGLPLDSTRLWGKLGATPMIGVNDVIAEVFTQADAYALVEFAVEHGLGRVAMWSANRDAPCPGGPDTTQVSNNCSGLAQEVLEFSRILEGAAIVDPTAGPATTTSDTAPDTTAAGAGGAPPTTAPVAADDPATSPYAVWDARDVYEEGDRTVRGRQVYVAKWWTQGDDPVAPVANVHDSPWRLVGPVLDTDRPTTTTTLLAGTYPEWDSTVAYRMGNRVLRRGVGYQARWFAQGVDPAAPPSGDGPSPWEAIGED